MENGISPYIAKVSLARRLTSAIAAFIVVIALFTGSAVQAQTYVPPGPGQDWGTGNSTTDLSQDANNTDPTARYIYDQPGQTTLVREQAEQNTDAVAQNVEAKLWPAFGSYNETYEGLAAFWGDDIISNFFANIGQIIGKWLSEFINGWVADAVQFLTGFLRIFVLNPNIATNGLAASGGPADDISPYIRQGADIMYGIAVDLLLLLFILCIWKYWAEAAWRGGGNLMGAVGRLIFTAGLMLAWPTIYAFEIQISNEMIRAIYFNSADQVAMLDAAMAAAVKAGLVAGAGLLANATAPVAGQVFGGLLGAGPGGLILGTVGSLVAFVGLILYLIVGGVLIAQLVYILVLKAIQTGLLCAQYMFAPIFLVFFATPDTENVTSGFVRSFVEVSLWTFVWVGLLKIMVIVVLSNFNPWGKIVMAIGVLQIMIQVPSFLARAQISPMSDFISAGLITGGLLSAGKALTNGLGHRAMHLANAVGNFGYAGAKGSPKSQGVDLNVPQGVNNEELLKNKREAERTGKVPGQGPDNPGGQPLNPIGPKGPKTGPDGTKLDKNGNPIPPTGKGINPLTGKPDGTGVGPDGAKAAQDAGLNPTGAKGDGTTIPTPPKTGKEGTLANAAADAAKTGLGTAAVAGGLTAAMAAAQAPGLTGGQTPGAKDEQGRQGDLSAQQAAEALKALKDQNNAGPNGAGKGAVNPDSKDLKSATGVPGGKDANSKLEGKEGAVPGTGVDAKLQEKGKDGSTATNAAAAAAAAAANVGKDLKPGDLANALPKGADKTATGPTGGKNAEMDVEVERDPASTAGSAAAAAAALNSLKSGGTEGGVKGAGTGVTGPDAAGQKTSLRAPGTEGLNGQVTTDVKGNLVSKPGESPNKDGKPVVPPAASAALGDAAKNISRGAADPTTVAVNSDIAPDGDPGAPLQQVRGNALNTANSTGKADQSATPGGGLDTKDVVTAAGLGTAAGLAAAKLTQGAATVDQKQTAGGKNVASAGGGDVTTNVTGQLNTAGQPVSGAANAIPPVGGVNVSPDGANLEGADAILNPGRTAATINTTGGANQQQVTPGAGLNAGDIASTAAASAALGVAANKLTQPGGNTVDARLTSQGGKVSTTGVPTGTDANANLTGNLNPNQGNGQSVVNPTGVPQVGGVNVTPDGANLEGADATLSPGRTAATITNTGAGVNQAVVTPNAGLNPGDITGAAANAGANLAAGKLNQQGGNTVDARLANQSTRVSPTGVTPGADGNANLTGNLGQGQTGQAAVSPSGIPPLGGVNVTPDGANLEGADATLSPGRTAATITNTAAAGNNQSVVTPNAGLNPGDIAGAAAVNAGANLAAGKLTQQGAANVDARLANQTRVNPTGVNVGGDQNTNLNAQINPTTGQPVVQTGTGMPQVGGVNVTPDGASLEGADASLTPGRTAATINNSGVVNTQTVQQPTAGLNPGDIAGAAVAGAGIVAAANKLGQQAAGTVDARLTNQGRVNTTVSPSGSGDLNANVQSPVTATGASASGIPVVPPSAFNVNSVDAGQDVDASGMQGRTSATIQNTAQPGTVQQQQGGINPADVAAGVAGVNSGINAARQGQQSSQTVNARVVGAGRTGSQTGPAAPETIFTQAQVGGGGNNGGQPPARFTTMDGGDGGDDGSGGNGSGFNSGGTVPPANGPNRGGAPTPPPSNPDVIEGFNQAGYNKVPMRVAAANIRLAQGATIGRSGTGNNYAVYDSQGHVMHYRFDESATPEQKAMGIMAGSFGELMSSDAEAYDAARMSAIEAGEHKPQGALERVAAGILAYNGGSWTQTAAAKQRFARSMAKHAAIGSQAYISGEKGNAYTEFLENRYGVMDDDRQAEAVHIMTTDATPESGWSWRLQPATEALIQNGIGINPLNRACAANMAVLKAQPWLRGAAIRGSAAYIDSKANAAIPDGTHSMVRDSWYAHHAQAMTPEVVNCVGALTLATGDVEVCRNAPLIDQVVSMVPAGGRPEDYVGAYNALQTGTAVVQRLVSSGGGGGGGGGSINMGSQTVSSASSGGNVNMGSGPVSTSVTGSVVGGGGGYNNAEMDLLMDPPSQSQAMPNINPGSLNVGNVQMPGNATNVNVRTHTNAAGGQNLGSMSVRMPGQNVGSSQGQVQIGSVQNMGGGQGGTDNVTVDVEIGDNGAPGSSYADVQAAAVSSALQYFGGSAPELIKNVVADLKATGMSWQDIQNPNLMATAIQSYSTNPNSLPQVAIASNAMGADSVTTADVQIVQDMQDADPRWDAKSIDYGAVYTSQCIVEAHMADPQAFGQPYLTKDYVDKVRLDPRFRPREVPRRGANGQVGYAEKTPVPADVILNHLQDQMRRFGGGGGRDRY
ncbi:MAG: hypothetical protein HY986_18070 [Candidatus Melainabacteria bacterium]|nr:hypothetical protein [Candidatus Melainabacteria bacterium]